MATNFLLHSHRHVASILKPLAARYEQHAADEVLVQVIRDYMQNETCDFEIQTSVHCPVEGTQPDAVRCGSGNRICAECGWCKFHCDCEKEN